MTTTDNDLPAWAKPGAAAPIPEEVEPTWGPPRHQEAAEDPGPPPAADDATISDAPWAGVDAPTAAPWATEQEPEDQTGHAAPLATPTEDGYLALDTFESSITGSRHQTHRPPNDEVEAEAQQYGMLVISPDDEIDPEAARLVPAKDLNEEPVGAIGVRFNEAGHVVVAWPHLPKPHELEAMANLIGHTVYPAVAGLETWELLREQLAAGEPARAKIKASSTRGGSLLTPLVDELLRAGASDLHLSASEHPWMRVGGTFRSMDQYPRLMASDMVKIAREIVGDEFNPDTFGGDLDTSVTFGTIRFRVNLYRERGQLALALRTIPIEIPPFDILGLPAQARRLISFKDGLVIFAGATGSGKSTSLAALLNILNESRESHIITIEKPIEYTHSSKMSMVHQREVGDDTDSFATALKSVLREDPDVILLGEMRDYEEIEMAITLAETGHLVFTTVHAQNTGGVIDRIVSVFPNDQQNQIRTELANTMRGVVCQKLLPDAKDSRRRHLAYEIAFINDAIRSAIRPDDKGRIQTGKITEAVSNGHKEGMKTFDRCLAELVVEEKVGLEEASRAAVDIKLFQDLLDGLRAEVHGVNH